MLKGRMSRSAPVLPRLRVPGRVARKSALLVMPFYPKNRHGSLGKHVLTPALTLSAVAAPTPADWQIRIWDENLLQGPPPGEPVPEIVGITVHLTFAHRAYELAAWYRARGARVILGGLHVQSCPGEAANHADAISLGNGVETWPRILRDVESGCLAPVYQGNYETPFSREPRPRRELVDRASFLTSASLIATRGCANRCGFCYLSTSSVRSRYEVRDPGDVARELAALEEPYAVFIDNNLGSDREYLRSISTFQGLEESFRGVASRVGRAPLDRPESFHQNIRTFRHQSAIRRSLAAMALQEPGRRDRQKCVGMV